MAEYNPSKIIKDGNTYNFRDTTKIPLAGSNAISGDLIPSTNGAYDLGSSSCAFRKGHIAALYSTLLSNTTDSGAVNIWGGTGWNTGAAAVFFGKDDSTNPNAFVIRSFNSDNSDWFDLRGTPSGTLTWSGQPIQYTSDQRLKQQIAQIDDDLLTAWEDVNLVQFKYNDAVEEKSDNARLHTGYVVQQIDDACKSHNVDISKYGLYCHEEYTEETREVEHDDGTKTTEVVRPANEHYSLRYTEALIVECAYLRKCIKELRTEIEQLKSSK